MRSKLHLFHVSSTNVTAPPAPGPILDVEAKSEDALLEAAHALVTSRGERVRALCFGAKGLVAYVEKSA
ncbi:MAG TPA: hypothetical protein VKP30_16895 [Polyangiaceae bacterium]|nr:hypothetical protein [Polyangiaceae bacterium]